MSDRDNNSHAPVLRETRDILFRNLEIASSAEESAVNPSYEELKRMIAERIRQMLSTNYEQLLNLLYRIDIPESRVAEALSEYPPNEVPEMLAEMIIERQRQKVVTRQQYRK